MDSWEIDRRARLSITRFFELNGFAPTMDDIASIEKLSRAEIEQSFRRLNNQHQLSLSPDFMQLRAAHPYSALPTAYWVESGGKGWWANCAFCALGVAVIAGNPAKIYTRLGAMNEAVTLLTGDQTISPDSFRLHIPLPIRQWHDDIIFTCSNVHLFHNSMDIDKWAKMNHLPRGSDLSLKEAWQLARSWYANYLDDDWRPHSAEKLRELFWGCGLTGVFWEPAESD